MKPSVSTASIHGDRRLSKGFESCAREVLLRRQRPDYPGEDEELLVVSSSGGADVRRRDHLGEEIPTVADHEHERRVLGAAVIRSEVTALQALGQQV